MFCIDTNDVQMQLDAINYLFIFLYQDWRKIKKKKC